MHSFDKQPSSDDRLQNTIHLDNLGHLLRSCRVVTDLALRLVHLQIDKGTTLLDCTHFVIAVVVTDIIVTTEESI